jgi:hypothetical protein
MLGIEQPEYKTKDHLYSGRDNLNMFEYQKAYFKALKMFDTVSCAESIFSIVEHAYKTKRKIFIDYRELGLRSNGNGKFIFEIIKRFNKANGINDVRTGDSFKAILDKKREVAHTIQNDLYSVCRNATGANEIRDFDNIDIRPQTKAKFKKWLKIDQDKKEVQNIYFELMDFIQNPSNLYDVETINGRNEIIKKQYEQKQQIKPFAEAWAELKENLFDAHEFNEFLKLSILNIDEMEAIQSGDEFYKEWLSYNKAKEHRQKLTIKPFKQQIREKQQLLYQYKKGA